MFQQQRGFTLIEIMIVVSIIGILSSIAVSAYQTYLIRSRIAEGMNIATTVKSAIWDVYANKGDFPAGGGNDQYALPDPIETAYIRNITVGDQGVISILFKDLGEDASGGKTIELHPDTSNSGSISWICYSAGKAGGAATMPPKYAPPVCR